MNRTLRISGLAALAAGCITLAGALLPGRAAAQQDYPTRPISLVVPFGSGGATDALARIFAQGFADTIQWNVVVENKPGAGGSIGATLVARSAPDGYTWLLGTIGTQTANQYLYRQLSYDPERDFRPIALIGSIPNLLVASPSLGVSTVPELLEKARSQPGGLSYSSSGVGTSGHLAVEQLRSLTGIPGAHVPYKNAGQGHTDLASGRIDFAIDNFPVMLPFVKAGKLVPLAITSRQRNPLLPDVPTMQEAGVQGYESSAWFGLFVPRDVPASAAAQITDAARKVLAQPTVRKRLEGMGITVGTTFDGDFGAFVADERTRMRQVIETAGIPPQ